MMNSHALFTTATTTPCSLNIQQRRCIIHNNLTQFSPISNARINRVSTTLSCRGFFKGELLVHVASHGFKKEECVKKKKSIVVKAEAPGTRASAPEEPKEPEKRRCGGGGGKNKKAEGGVCQRRARIGVYFVVWWSLNVVFNVYNKKVLNVLPFPWLTSTLSLAAGSAIMLVSWALKLVDAPHVDCDFWKRLAPVAVAHTIGHVAATISMSKVAVSFTHIIKSAEPAFSVLIQRLVFGEHFPLTVYLALLPIIGGCALAAATELHFNTIGLSPTTILDFVRHFGYSRVMYLGCKFLDYLLGVKGQCHCWCTGFAGAMISNVAFVFRNIFSKRGMSNKDKNMGGMNYYACLSMMSLAFLTPFAFAIEGPKAWAIGWTSASLIYGNNQLLWWVVAQSVFYHLYNQVSYMSLDEISPLTFSIGNTIKRVTVIVSSILIFHTKLLPINVVGAAIAILGTFLYSQIKQ